MAPDPLKTRFSRTAAMWYDQWLEAETYHIEPPDTIITRIAIVGMRHQGVPEDMLLDAPVILQSDPDNKFDPHAIRVLCQDQQIGWVPRKDTGLFHHTPFDQEGDLVALPKVISGVELYLYVISCV